MDEVKRLCCPPNDPGDLDAKTSECVIFFKAASFHVVWGFAHGRARSVSKTILPELDAGRFLLTQSNPIHQRINLIQSISGIK